MLRARRSALPTFGALAALALLLAACTNSDATPTPEASPTPEVTPTEVVQSPTSPPAASTHTPEPTPTPIPVFTAGEYTLEDVELLVVSVRFQNTFPSDQMPDRLDRVYRGDDGQIHVDPIPFPEDPDGHPPVLFFTPITADPTGQELAVTFCIRGDCGGFTRPSEDAMSALYRSSDGGNSWHHEADIQGGIRVLDWSQGEFVLWRDAPEGQTLPIEEQYWRYPSGTLFLPPDAASSATGRPSYFDSPHGPLWWSEHGYVDASGAMVVPFPDTVGSPAGVEFLPDGRRFWTWAPPSERDPGGHRHAAVFDANGEQLTPTLQVPYGCCSATPDGRILVGTAPLPEWIDTYADQLPVMQDGKPYPRQVPGFLDPETGAIEAITDPFLRAVYQDRDQIGILAVIPAPSP